MKVEFLEWGNSPPLRVPKVSRKRLELVSARPPIWRFLTASSLSRSPGQTPPTPIHFGAIGCRH
jgi:hypothetical protein